MSHRAKVKTVHEPSNNHNDNNNTQYSIRRSFSTTFPMGYSEEGREAHPFGANFLITKTICVLGDTISGLRFVNPQGGTKF